MCTAMTLQTAQGETLFGRTMDFSYLLDPHLYYVPQGYRWRSLRGTAELRARYGLLGIGQMAPSLVLVDGVNERGLAGAALYFPGYAHFTPAAAAPSQPTPVAAIELLPYLLGNCADVDALPAAVSAVRIVGVEDPVTRSVAPLHWIFCDRSGKCAVLEQTRSGTRFYPNPIGVLANSPDFPWHLTNLRNYVGVTPQQQEDAQWGETALTPFGQGGGTAGLPGGFTPPARFVRVAFLKTHTPRPQSREEAVVTGFHILESVSIPKGVVRTQRQTDDFTQYIAFCNTATGEYFIRTYDNSEIVAARLREARAEGGGPTSQGKLLRPVTFFRL